MLVMIQRAEDERRTFVRVVTTLPAAVAALDAAGEWRRVGAVVLNISVGGARLRAEEPFEFGERVQVAIELPDGQGQLEASADIEECDPDLEAFNIRAKFSGLPGEAILRLARWTLADSKAAD
jgi:hypothetical protein